MVPEPDCRPQNVRLESLTYGWLFFHAAFVPSREMRWVWLFGLTISKPVNGRTEATRTKNRLKAGLRASFRTSQFFRTIPGPGCVA